MTSPDRRRRAAALLVAVLPLSGALAGCTLGQASSFTGRAEASCRSGSQDIGPLPTGRAPRDLLVYSLDRFAEVDRVVSEISTDIAFPGGARGITLRREWIDPAVRSLDAGREDLRRLRDAVVADDQAAADRAFARSVAAGTVGVDVAAIRAAGLPACATLFGPDPEPLPAGA